MTMLEDRIRKALNDAAPVWPERTAHSVRRSTARPLTVVLLAAAAVFVLIGAGTFMFFPRTSPSDLPPSQGVTPSESIPPTPTSTTPTSLPVPDPVPDPGSTAYVDAIEEILTADAFIAGTIETMGDPDENYKWCCENPPLTFTDIEVLESIGGEFDETSFRGFSYQDLPAHVQPGDRVHMLLIGDTVLYMFGKDENIAHPVTVDQAAAVDLLREKEGAPLGWTASNPLSPEKAIRWTWSRYTDPWWGSAEHRLALALSGIEGHPTVCSAADMVQLAEDDGSVGATDELPPEVAATRKALLDASINCDFETLYQLGGGDEAALTSNSPYSFAGIYSVDDIAFLDTLYGLGRQLVIALTMLPSSVYQYGGGDNADDDPYTAFAWPPDLGIRDGQPVENLWDDELASIVAYLNNVSTSDFMGSPKDNGSYALFRVHILDDGTLLTALAGD